MKTNFITQKNFQEVTRNKVNNKKLVNYTFRKENQYYVTGIKVLIKINKNK
jgi:hypothetical protein